MARVGREKAAGDPSRRQTVFNHFSSSYNYSYTTTPSSPSSPSSHSPSPPSDYTTIYSASLPPTQPSSRFLLPPGALRSALPSTMVQSPMLSSPLKQTNEIDWVQPLKDYIKQSYGEDPERYHQECSTLNRLRQDMRGAGKDSATGRDLLYRYYGQLELLDLRFPVDESHIKISFTW